MFRLISLKVYEHPFLGTIKEGLCFVPEIEIKNKELPYTTVIIGSNGTGKSSILALIAEIFDDLNKIISNPKTSSKIKFKYEINYIIDNLRYSVGYNFQVDLKNRKHKEDIFSVIIDKIRGKKISDIKIPSKIIVISYLANDRFRAKKNEPNDYYIYLGLRDQSNTARTRAFLNSTLPLLFDYIIKEKSVVFLKSILEFMKMNPDYLGISYEYRYKKSFFTGHLNIKDFELLFEEYSSFSGREKTPFGVDYFKANIQGHSELISRLVNYLNFRTIQDSITYGEKSYLNFNLFDNHELIEELELINHLRKLDIISSASLMLRKGVQEPHDADEISSGEFHFLTTMIAIQSSIDENSLLLIDEPEISFHPNWQMRYVDYLKKLFQKWSSAHFILSTHSHFIVSDLEGRSSEIIGLNGFIPNIKAKPIKKSTYGWSAEQILFEVFEVVTDRNYYLSLLVQQVIDEMAKSKPNKKIINENIVKLKGYNLQVLNDQDPFKAVIKQLIHGLEKK